VVAFLNGTKTYTFEPQNTHGIATSPNASLQKEKSKKKCSK
jgi:hypothetical protein